MLQILDIMQKEKIDEFEDKDRIYKTIGELKWKMSSQGESIDSFKMQMNLIKIKDQEKYQQSKLSEAIAVGLTTYEGFLEQLRESKIPKEFALAFKKKEVLNN